MPAPENSPATERLKAALRRHDAAGLDAADVDPDPLVQVQRWWDEVADDGLAQPPAVALATATPDGRPSVRFVLVRGFDERGFAFFTNERSRKGRELTANPYASLVFAWHDVGWQVRVDGRVERVDGAEADAYFGTRPRGSQLSAWASPQSEVVADRAELDRLRLEQEQRWADGDVERPPFWGGWRLMPDEIELWQQRANRYHDRLRYRRVAPQVEADGGAGSGQASAAWIIERLAP